MASRGKGALSWVAVGLDLGPEHSRQETPLVYPRGKQGAADLASPGGGVPGGLSVLDVVCLGRGSIYKAPL